MCIRDSITSIYEGTTQLQTVAAIRYVDVYKRQTMLPLSRPEFMNIHPYAPEDQVEGYTELIENLSAYLCEITGFKGCTLQPNSGAAGEYTGLRVIRAYLESIGQGHRNICLLYTSRCV